MNLEGRLAVTAFVKGCETVGAGKVRSHATLKAIAKLKGPVARKITSRKAKSPAACRFSCFGT